MPRCPHLPLLPRILSIALACALQPTVSALAQSNPQNSTILQQHYDRAQSLAAEGDAAGATQQYRIFIADALNELAVADAHIGDGADAAPLFEEALRLAPNSPGVLVEYARSSLHSNNLSRARNLAEQVLRNFPGNTKACAKAQLVLGQVDLRQDQDAEARKHIELAVALDPDFEDGYALTVACLDLGDGACADTMVCEMTRGLGDSAALHMAFGRAFLNSDFQQQSLPQFQQAVADDPKLAQAHYMLAVAYLTVGGNQAPALGEAELRAALSLSPDLAAAHVQLGTIALHRQQYDIAEKELQQALAQNPDNPDALLALGQLYSETNRDPQAIDALRRSIANTPNPAYNRFQVQKAHYLLGRLLLKAGQRLEGAHEMVISSDLLRQSLAHDRSQLAGYLGDADGTGETPDAAIDAPTATHLSPAVMGQAQQQKQAVAKFRTQLSPAIADSYNNLGVLAAKSSAYADALVNFEHAYEWNPTLPGLDENWGRAAYLSGDFPAAVPPLARSLATHPEKEETRSMLAISEFACGNYAATVETLHASAPLLQKTPQLAYVFYASLLHSGSYRRGLEGLQTMEKQDPQLAEVHLSLGQAYAQHGNAGAARHELQRALQLNPQDAQAASTLRALTAGSPGPDGVQPKP
jgi:tetratricopeptide (TPR) repeat protein